MDQTTFYSLPAVQEQLNIQKQNPHGSEKHKAAYFRIGEIAKANGIFDIYKAADGDDYWR